MNRVHAQPALRPAALANWRTLLARLMAFAALAHQRRELTTLTEAQLDDMGLSRQQVDAEAQRPFWDVPQNWRR